MAGYTYQKWREPDGELKASWEELSEDGRAKYARALAMERDISWKAAREIASVIRGWPLQDAIEYLEGVQRKEFHVPYRMFTRQITHRRLKVFKGEVTGEVHRLGGPSGRYPVLAAKEFVRALRYAEAYAQERDLNTDYLRLEHIASHMGPIHMSYMPRAHGRATEKKRHRVNIEVVVREDEKLAEKAESGSPSREE